MRSMNKRKLPLEFPCRCGHYKRMHGWAGPSIGDEWCNGFSDDIRLPTGSPCDCMSFVPDNLKYLEKCLQKREVK
jgi:hypothetical protein